MCGISGIIGNDPAQVNLDILQQMTDKIAHRGPDGAGHWIDEQQKVALGHRRLSIIDLSETANQPMHYLDRYTIVFNGEIYNYIELREDLLKKGYTFKTQGDTEVLMALYDQHKEGCLEFLDGMFAFAIYDTKEQTVFCARDRFGEKPFFFHHQPGKVFYFASEMKALWAAGVSAAVNPAMLYNYLQDGYLENPNDASETFYLHCKRLPHAHWLKLDLQTLNYQVRPYYQINWKFEKKQITVPDAIEQFQHLMRTSVKRRLRSDVPVGSSLSGGLDSSLVVCLIDELIGGTGQIQKTFSAVFPGFEKDESKYIHQVVNATHADAHYVTPNEQDLEREMQHLLYHQEEPVGSASIYVQYCVMRLAKEQGVTVLLDGQGADEILAGYHFFYKRFFYELSKNNKSQYRQELAAYQQLHADNSINQIVHGGLSGKLAFAAQPFLPTLHQWKKNWEEMQSPFFDKNFYQQHRGNNFSNQQRETSLNEALHNAVFKKGLQELLRYADRNSMAHSREVRVPFLSHELVNFLFTLPAQFKIHDGWTKWIMRKSFDQVLPKEIAWRKDKIGYEPPQKNWLQSKYIQEMMQESKSKLIAHQILHPQLQNKQQDAPAATASGKNSWRIWMAGSMLK